MEVDYVIVGAGSAGCVLAERLSASGRHRVLVIEAGGSDRRWAIRMPLGYAFTFTDPRVTWRYTTAPDPGLAGREAYWPRGRVIGGCSSINAMAYVRGLPGDYDAWEEAGARGWNWRSVEAAFQAIEREEWASADGTRRTRGEGPVPVADLRQGMHPFSTRMLDAAGEVGWPLKDHGAHMDREGLSYYRSTVRDGRRFSAADAFLAPARTRANVQVLANALVTRLDVGGNTLPRVHLRRGDREFSIAARGEIILSAGAINSPQLLQLSGLGPAALLADHGIRVVRPLEQVGRGLQDHLAISHLFEAREPTLNSSLARLPGQILAGLRYLATRGGPLSVPINQVGGFMRSHPQLARPDMQIYGNPAAYRIPASGRPSLDTVPGYALSAQPCRPTSRGTVRIRSADLRDAPEIQANSLATEEDRRDAIAAGKLVRSLASAPTLRAVTKACRTPDLARISHQVARLVRIVGWSGARVHCAHVGMAGFRRRLEFQR
jgi:choline dehydrogenase